MEYHNLHITEVKTGGDGCLSFFLGLIGIVCLVCSVFAFAIFFLPAGLIGIIGAFLTDPKYRLIGTCGGCGNEVAITSKLCPTCGAKLIAPGKGTPATREQRLIKAAFYLMVFGALAMAAYIAVKIWVR